MNGRDRLKGVKRETGIRRIIEFGISTNRRSWIKANGKRVKNDFTMESNFKSIFINFKSMILHSTTRTRRV